MNATLFKIPLKQFIAKSRAFGRRVELLEQEANCPTWEIETTIFTHLKTLNYNKNAIPSNTFPEMIIFIKHLNLLLVFNPHFRSKRKSQFWKMLMSIPPSYKNPNF